MVDDPTRDVLIKMTNRIILPKDKVEVDEVIFLAGPVRAGGEWQNKAIEYIRKKNSEVYIAVPDYGVAIKSVYGKNSEKSGKVFQSQLDWEQYYLEIAEKKGSILLWLAGQTEEMPINEKTRYHKPHARDTRPEIGGWGWGSLRHNPSLHVAVGGEEGFDGLSVQRRNFAKYASHIPFRETLEETCEDALKFLKN